MPLTEPMLFTTSSPSDEAALARLQGVGRAKTPVELLTDQIHALERQNFILELQAHANMTDATKWRNRYRELYRAIHAARETREPRSYAEKLRAKRC